MFDALILRQQNGSTTAQVETLSTDQLPQEDVLVAIDYSSINYKDALAITGQGKIIREFPFVPGIDLAGRVLESANPAFQPGDEVLLTGWGVGERHWGGLAQRARVKADWLLPLPAGLDSREAMVLGTAGLTAALCVMALEQHGLTPDSGPMLVTGASGGVGSIAITLLHAAGYEVAAVSGRQSSHDYLHQLGADEIITRATMQQPSKPLESQRWAGVIDTTGGNILARALAETRYGGCIAACGLAADHRLETTVMPFILRAVTLQGIDSVYCSKEERKKAWNRLAKTIPSKLLDSIANEIPLTKATETAHKLLQGKLHGRTIVRL